MADKNLIEDESINLKDVSNINEEDPVAAPIVQLLMEKYNKAETTRRNDEERWLRAYRNYRGLYGPDVQFTEAEKSRVFIKVTKTKTLAAYGQIVDVLFSNNNFPISVDPTVLPEGVVDTVSFDPAEEKIRAAVPNFSPYGFKGDGKELPPGATFKTLLVSTISMKVPVKVLPPLHLVQQWLLLRRWRRRSKTS